MKKSLIIILISTLLISCLTKAKHSQFDGMWTSDSLNSNDRNHWKEFLFIDSLGNVTRTTRWGRNYILDSNLIILDSTVLRNGITAFNVRVLDSNIIELTSKGFYGRFYRDKKSNSAKYHKNLLEFKLNEENKRKLEGQWELTKVEMENDTLIPTAYLESLKNDDFWGHSVTNKLTVNFSKDDEFLILSNNDTSSYRYIVSGDDVVLFKSDYIINMNFIVKNDTFRLIHTLPGSINRKLFFRRTE